MESERDGEGAERTARVVAEHHDVSLALLAATVLPGGGQAYNGQTMKAALLLAAFIVALGVVLVRPGSTTALMLVGLFELAVWVVGLVDAGIVAGRLIRHERVKLWRWF